MRKGVPLLQSRRALGCKFNPPVKPEEDLRWRWGPGGVPHDDILVSDYFRAINDQHRSLIRLITELGYDLNSPLSSAEEDRVRKALKESLTPQQRMRASARITRKRRRAASTEKTAKRRKG